MNRQELFELIDKYLTGKASKEETERFFYLIEQPEYADEFHAILEEQYREGLFDTEPNEKLRQLVQARLHTAIQNEASKSQKSIVRRMPWKWIAAACIVLITGYGLWVTSGRRSQGTGDRTEIAKTQDIPAPSNTRAVITLADGSTVYLDSTNNGTIAQQNNVTVVKNANGQILYQGNANSDQRMANSPVYNTLSNPRGSKVIDMILSDGSHVWLNAGSSITYPVAFIGKDRKITMNGEAYFEVAHDASKPFIVSKGATIVTVLGTHFNVNAYDDEDALKVTLLEGSVKVFANNNSVTIKPNQQAVVSGGLSVNNDVDVEAVMAWKNEKFAFGERTGIREIMRQLARWYDVEVVYQDNIQQQFGGSISRQSNISQVLEKLELTGKIHFKIEGKKITVMK
jgi:ferric-dicitrate binding protein FerR (iron transport regulator)